MSAERPVDLSMLLQHDALLRRLAVRLAGPADGEDAVQETWLAAIRQGGLRPGTAKSWLAVALKRFIAGGRRTGARAKRREAAVARRDVAPSAAEIVEREAARREVVAALLALDPIYRDALLLRYESDLPPRKVAAALGIPVETARTRIKRGLVMMRRHLDGRLGPDGRSALVLLLARANAPAVGVAALGMVAAGILVTVVVVVATRGAPAKTGAPQRESLVEVAPAVAAAPSRGTIRPRSSSSALTALVVLDERETSGDYPCAEPRDTNGAHRSVATRVIDELTGDPVAGARVMLVDEAAGPEPLGILEQGTADADGWVRLGVEAHRDRTLGVYWSADGFGAGAVSGAVPPFPIRLQRAGERTIRVVDAAGTPLPGATVRWRVGSPRFGAGAGAITGKDGLVRVAGIDPASGFLVASHSGHAGAELALAAEAPGAPPSDVVLPPARRCEGVAVRGGAPAAGAIVRCPASADAPVVSDENGRVDLPAAVAGAPISVTLADGVTRTFAGPPPGRPFRLDFGSGEPAPKAPVARLTCVGPDGARVPGVPLCITSTAGDVTRTGSDETGVVLASLPEGAYDVTTDDLDAAAEVVPARVTVGPGAAEVDITLDALARPGVLVEIARELSTAARVLLLTDDASCDVTGAVRGGETVPVPLRGPARVVLVDGADREARSLPDARAPGSVLAARFDGAASSRRAAGVELFVVAVRDALDQPVSGARVVVEGESGPLAGTAGAGGDAVFEASAVKAGGAIAVRAPGFAPVFGRVGSPDAARISWPGTALEVVVKGPDPTGFPPPVVIVDGEPVYLERGAAAVAGLAPGEHVAVVAAVGWIPKVVRFELTGAADAVLEVVLRPQPR